MTWMIDDLIRFLTELRSMSSTAQFLTLAGIPGIVLFFAGIPVWLTTRKVRQSVVAHDALEARLKTAHREAAKLQAELDRLEAETPEAFLADDLGDAAGIARASGLRVKLKGDRDRAGRAARDERLPRDLRALTEAFFRARDAGHSALMLFLADHGCMLTRPAPFGEGSREHLLFRRHRVLALHDAGRSTEALEDAKSLVPEIARAFGEQDVETLHTRHLIALCRKDTGDAATALAELEELLPFRTEVQGARHPHVLDTRGLIAACRKDTGDAATALSELEELLPFRTEVQGAGHPDVLDTRRLRAACLLDENDRAGAEEELEGVREGLEARNLRPEHRYLRRLEEVEARLRLQERPRDEA